MYLPTRPTGTRVTSVVVSTPNSSTRKRGIFAHFAKKILRLRVGLVFAASELRVAATSYGTMTPHARHDRHDLKQLEFVFISRPFSFGMLKSRNLDSDWIDHNSRSSSCGPCFPPLEHNFPRTRCSRSARSRID